MQLPELIEPFIAKLEAMGVPYFVTGSAAGIMYGEPRMTHDVDLVVRMRPRDIPAFVAAFPDDEYYCPPAEVLEVEIRREQRGHCNVISHATGFKADVYFAFDELHDWAMQHRRHIELGQLNVAVAPPEYVILRKLEYFRERRSQKHLRDIRSMLEVSGNLIDQSLIETRCRAMGLLEIWQRASADR